MVFEYTHKNVEAVHLNLNEFDRYANDDDWHPSTEFNMRTLAEVRHDRRKKSSWAGRSLEDVRKAVKTGWKEGLADLKKSKDKIKLPHLEIKSTRRKRRPNNLRGNVNTDKLTNGQQQGLFTRRQREISNHQPIISIVCSIGGHAGMSTDQLFWCGATACFLAEQLERAGYRTEIVGSSMALQDCGRYVNVSVSVKRPDEQFRLSTLAAVLALPATFRSMFFMCRDKAAKTIKVGSGQGRTGDITARDFHIDNPAWRKGAVIVPHIYDGDSSRRFIMDSVKSIEVGRVGH